MDNKKGQLLIAGILGILAVIILALILISTKVRFILIGVALFVCFVFILVKGKMNKTKGFFAVVLFVVSIFFMFGSGLLQQELVPGTYIQAPTFFYYECNAASQPVESIHTSLSTGSTNGWVTCPSNTDECTLWVSQTEQTGWYSDGRRIVYQICHAGGSCDNQVFVSARNFLAKKNVPSVNIPLIQGDKVWIDYQKNDIIKWNLVPNGAEYYANYKPFILWRVDMFNGGKTEYTSIQQGCNFPSSDVPKLINSVTNSKKQFNTQTTTSNSNVPFYKTRSFIGTYVPLATGNVNFVTYGGKQGYCLQRQVFAITTVTTNGATYQIVDNNFNTLLAPSVDCCPGENEPTRTCTSDFKWQNKDQPGSCSAFKACAGATWQCSSSKTLERYNCVDSACVKETKTVDCCSNADCQANYQCDTLLYKCVEVGPPPIPCLPNQTLVNGRCVDNTNNSCSWYQQPYVKEVKDWGFLGWRHIFNNPLTHIESGCKTAGWIYFAMGMGTLIIIAIAYMVINKKPTKRKVRKK